MNLYRAGTSLLLGLGLIFLEAFIIMELKDYSVMKLGTTPQFISVWIINSFLVFAILTDIKNWMSTRENPKMQSEL
ncbi:MAG TPA: hypothetical protein GX497_14595 [Bacillus bacterium]|nr:hypothetical protein [Bacillus sp. (in: firmicutes)]